MTRRALIRFVKSFRVGILNGQPSHRMCFAICAPLQTMLHLAGVDTELVEADFSETVNPINHVWLRCLDGTIIDPTADQFGLQAVYVGPLPKLYSRLMVAPPVVEGTPHP